MLVCHHNDVCENSIGGVYVGGYDGLSESGIGCWHKLCPVVLMGSWYNDSAR